MVVTFLFHISNILFPLLFLINDRCYKSPFQIPTLSTPLDMLRLSQNNISQVCRRAIINTLEGYYSEFCAFGQTRQALKERYNLSNELLEKRVAYLTLNI